MPPADAPGPGKRRPRKRAGGSIRDAAASAAGSAATPPPRTGGTGRPPLKSSIRDAAASAAGSAAVPTPPVTPPPDPAPPDDHLDIAPIEPAEIEDERIKDEAFEPVKAGGPVFPDYETPSTGWDPWDQTIEAPAGSDFDPNRTLGDWLEAVIPAEAQVHFIRAGQEFAAGVQTTVDHHLGRRGDGDLGPDGASRIEID